MSIMDDVLKLKTIDDIKLIHLENLRACLGTAADCESEYAVFEQKLKKNAADSEGQLVFDKADIIGPYMQQLAEDFSKLHNMFDAIDDDAIMKTAKQKNMDKLVIAKENAVSKINEYTASIAQQASICNDMQTYTETARNNARIAMNKFRNLKSDAEDDKLKINEKIIETGSY